MVSRTESSVDTVAVVCKLPTGLVCDVVDMEHYASQADAAKNNRPVYVKSKGKFRIRGYGEARASDSAGTTEMDSRRVVGRFGITQNIPKDLWDEWWAQNQDFPPVKGGLIFAHKQVSSVEAYAREHVELNSGFDPLDPENPDGKAKDAKGLRIKPEGYQGMPKMTD